MRNSKICQNSTKPLTVYVLCFNEVGCLYWAEGKTHVHLSKFFSKRKEVVKYHPRQTIPEKNVVREEIKHKRKTESMRCRPMIARPATNIDQTWLNIGVSNSFKTSGLRGALLQILLQKYSRQSMGIPWDIWYSRELSKWGKVIN